MARPNTAGPSFQYEVAGNSLGAAQQQQYDQTFEEYQQQNHMQGRHPQQRPGSAVPAAHAALRGGPGSDASFSFGMGPGPAQQGPAWQQQGQALSPPQQRPGMPGAGPAVPGAALNDESLSTAALGLLEDAIRDALRTNRSVSEGSRDKLMKMFK